MTEKASHYHPTDEDADKAGIVHIDSIAPDEAALVHLPVAESVSRSLSVLTPLKPDQHPAAVYLARLAPGSRRTMAASLELIAGLLTSYRHDMQTLNWSALRYQHTAAIRAMLADLYAPSTANKMLAALRGVLREAWRLGQLSAEDFHRAADIPPVRGGTLPRGRALNHGEMRALFEVCIADKSAAGRRDAAMLAVLYGSGLRRSELVALDVEDYDPQTGAIIVRSGKGNKARISYSALAGRSAIDAWLQTRGAIPGPLFCPINKGDTLVMRRMTDQAVRKMLNKRATASGVARFSPHDLRRTMISDLLDAGADISTVQRLAGHANVTTTTRYDRRGETAKRKAAEMLNIPYHNDTD